MVWNKLYESGRSVAVRFWGICFLGLVGAMFPQVAVQHPEPVYEGQNVAAIDLIANPHRDVEALRGLIPQKAGEPYSQSKIEAGIAALQGAGKFPKVTAEIVPDPSGLRVNFLLEPAYYLGMVSFPGATKLFPYIRLLQIANLPDEDPYDPARINVGKQSLQEFFQHNGYFQASIRTTPQIDDEHKIVNVAYAVNLGKQAKIGSVSFQGADASETARLEHATQSLRARFTGGLLKPGKAYSPARLSSATALIKRTLVTQHRLASHVEENPPQYDAAHNRVNVTFQVQVGPVVTVRVEGSRLSLLPFVSSRQIKKLVPIYSEGAIDRDLVLEGQQNLTDYFQKKGYFDVQVKTDFQRQPDKISLVYHIEKGKKHKVERIDFSGNHAVSSDDLQAVVVVKKGHLLYHGSVSQKLEDQSAKNIVALYRDRGYEDVKVTSQIVDHDPKVGVVFNIEEGAQTVVQDVHVSGNANFPIDQLTSPIGLQLRSGAAFSPRKLSEDRNRISASYLNRGYLNAEVKTSVKRMAGDPHRVDVSFNINEHQLVRINDVVYLGGRHTKHSLVEKTAQLHAEEPLSKGSLLKAESRLYDLNVFDWSSVGPRRPITDQDDETVLVKNHDAKRNEITYGFGFEVSHRGGNVPSGSVPIPGGGDVQLGNNQIAPSQSTFASPRGSIEFTRRDMRGMGETFTTSLLLSRLDQRALAAYTQPHFIGSEWSSLTSISAERTTENPLFGAGLGDASFQLERVLSKKNNTRLQLRYAFNRTVLSELLVPELVLEQDRNVHLSTFSASLVRDTRDKPLDAHKGEFSTATLGITPTQLGSSASFARFVGQYARYTPVHSVVFANSIRLGLAKAFSGSFVPTSELFFSGGGTSLRSFPIDQAGPQRIVPFCNVLTGQSDCVNVTVPVGGRQLFILNSEARFPLGIMKALGGVVFYDGGNVYSAINFREFVNSYTNTVGVGLRYATPVGPVRIDVGRNLNPVTGIAATQYYITLGQAF
jgi:outer membrane protein insertion porin family